MALQEDLRSTEQTHQELDDDALLGYEDAYVGSGPFADRRFIL